MKEPASVSWWGPADSPPTALVLLSALQHIIAATTLLTYPLLVAQAAGASAATTASFISLTLLAAGAGTLLQAFRLGPVGSFDLARCGAAPGQFPTHRLGQRLLFQGFARLP